MEIQFQAFNPLLSSHAKMLSLLRHRSRNGRSNLESGSCIGVARNTCIKNPVSKRKVYTCCSYNTAKVPLVPSDLELAGAKVIYSIAPAAGHNQESHHSADEEIHPSPSWVGLIAWEKRPTAASFFW